MLAARSGTEALHLGQVRLIGADDRDLKVYAEFLAKVRTYAKQHARRHLGRVRRREAQVAMGEVAQLGVDGAVDDHGADEHTRERDEHHRRHQVHAHPERPEAPHAGSTPSR